MYIFAIVIFIAILVGTIILGTPITVFLNLPSILIIVLITATMLMASGLFNDFKRAFKVIMSRDNLFSKVEIEKSYLAIELTIKLIINSGLLGSLIGLIQLLGTLNNPSTIGPNVAVMLLTLFYGLFGTFIFMPIKARLKSMLISFEEKK